MLQILDFELDQNIWTILFCFVLIRRFEHDGKKK
jgi:hypothetical protein